jgi:hypothetical protein
MDALFELPVPYFISLLVLIGFAIQGWMARRSAYGLPMIMVLGTVAAWYHGDAIYNDYSEYVEEIGTNALDTAWWQVLLFVVCFGLLAPAFHSMINRSLAGRRAYSMHYLETNALESPRMQHRIDVVAASMLAAWIGLMAVALTRVNFDFLGLFAPYLGRSADPWSRGRMGGGIDALLSLAGYLQIFLTAGFGITAALARNPRTRRIALLVCILAFPYYIFSRTRNTMIATMLPGILAWVAFRLKGGWMVKGAALAGFFLLINFWMAFVIANRHDGVIQALRSEAAVQEAKKARHEGLRMFSELAYMNDYFEKGTLQPSWGQRYFAELVNPIPRAIWKNKPTVGLDYAIARGFAWEGAGAGSGGVAASIATGMIGQGVVNFGGFFGPIAAAFLMALWVAVLARQDLLGRDPGRMLLYAVGMILTFNMGRDITFLVVYPYIFGWVLLTAWNYLSAERFQEWIGNFRQREETTAPHHTPPPAGLGGRKVGPPAGGPGMRPLPPGPVRKEFGAVARRGGPPGRVPLRRIRG